MPVPQPMRSSSRACTGLRVRASLRTSAIDRNMGLGPQAKTWSAHERWPARRSVTGGAVVGGGEHLDLPRQRLRREQLLRAAGALEEGDRLASGDGLADEGDDGGDAEHAGDEGEGLGLAADRV